MIEALDTYFSPDFAPEDPSLGQRIALAWRYHRFRLRAMGYITTEAMAFLQSPPEAGALQPTLPSSIPGGDPIRQGLHPADLLGCPQRLVPILEFLEDHPEHHPTHREMVTFETALTQDIGEALIDTAEMEVFRYCSAFLGFNYLDWADVVALSKTHLAALRPLDTGTERILQLYQLDLTIRKARDTGDHSSVLRALKQRAELAGLYETRVRSDMDLLIEAVAEVADDSGLKPSPETLARLRANQEDRTTIKSTLGCSDETADFIMEAERPVVAVEEPTQEES